ncbi:MAG: cytochrome b, partial [Alphaproteobacteria bacterium]
ILRAVPDKLLGVVLMFAAILVFFFLPWLDRSKVRSARFRPIYKQIYWVFLANGIVLGWVGANPPEGYFIVIGQIATAYYFLHLLVLIPLVGMFEKPRPLPKSISEPVLKGAGE